MTVIGITACRRFEDYRQAIVHAGGDARPLDPSMRVEDAIAGIDGLLLTGGGDVDPSRYGEPAHPAVVAAEAGRDEFEIALVHAARARQVPILAICRGVQVLNVACGGALVQDIPTQLRGALAHSLPAPPHESTSIAHEVWIEKDSLLSMLMRERLLDADSCDVNSRHHQAVKDLAGGFKVSATAPDGVIEAIEDPTTRFCLGVQWHPENFWRTGEFRPLFEGFLGASAEPRGARIHGS
jgi:putative glutamine amidotransferase